MAYRPSPAVRVSSRVSGAAADRRARRGRRARPSATAARAAFERRRRRGRGAGRGGRRPGRPAFDGGRVGQDAGRRGPRRARSASSRPRNPRGRSCSSGCLPIRTAASLGERAEQVHRLDLGRRRRRSACRRGTGGSFGLVVEPGPGHPVAGRVELQPEPRQDREPEDAVDRRPGQPQGVHADELERVLDPRLEVRQARPPLEVEPVDRASRSRPRRASGRPSGPSRSRRRGPGPRCRPGS